MAGIELANWNWRVVHQFVLERFGIGLSRSGCLNYLHRLGFAFKRPKKRLLKADGAKREAFVAEYAALTEEARESGARIFFADEAHFRADAELRGKWVLRGEPALVDSTSPRYGEKASYYSAVCLETGEVEWMELEGNSNAGTSAAFLAQLRQRHAGPLRVIWDNAPAHRGEAVWEYLRTPGLELRLVNLPGYSPDFNADEAVWGWAGEEATGNLCLGSREVVEERVGKFLAGLTSRKDEVRRRCRTVLQQQRRESPHPASAAFLAQLRQRHAGPLRVIWDNAPAHRGEAVWEYLRTPGLELRLVNLPGYSPDFNADEAVWGWAGEEATGNLCLGSREAVRERVGKFLAGLTSRKDEVRRRCRTVLQSRAESLLRDSLPESPHPANAHPTLALV